MNEGVKEENKLACAVGGGGMPNQGKGQFMPDCLFLAVVSFFEKE